MYALAAASSTAPSSLRAQLAIFTLWCGVRHDTGERGGCGGLGFRAGQHGKLNILVVLFVALVGPRPAAWRLCHRTRLAFVAQHMAKGILGGYPASLLGAAAAVLAASYIHRHLHGPRFSSHFSRPSGCLSPECSALSA